LPEAPIELTLGRPRSPPEARALLARLGIHRVVVPIPFEEEGPVNAYVIENGPEPGGVTLFDTGVFTDEGTAALTEGLRALGLAASDVTRVVISHGHLDHAGNAHWLAAAGAEVLAHPADWDEIAPVPADAPATMKRWEDLLVALGLSASGIGRIVRRRQHLEVFRRPLDRASLAPLADGAHLSFAAFDAEVLHVPGHTPGISILWIPSAGLMLTADHLLEHTSPNPVMTPGPTGFEDKIQSLVRYLESVRRVREMPVRFVAPGHGPLFAGHRELIDRLSGFYDRRQARILSHVAEAPGTTVRDVAELVFARAYDKALFLVLSEVLGNLEVLRASGRVTLERRRGEAARWYAVETGPG